MEKIETRIEYFELTREPLNLLIGYTQGGNGNYLTLCKVNINLLDDLISELRQIKKKINERES